jgi:hypothetical protein
MKFCKIYVRDIDIDIDRIPFQCGDKLPENGERKNEKERQRKRKKERKKEKERKRKKEKERKKERERKKEKHEIGPDKEKPKVLNPFEINCICSLLGQSEF